MRRVFAAIVVALGVLAPGASALAQNRPLVPAEKRYLPYTGEVPACDDPWVQGRIQSRFHEADREYWGSGLEFTGFDQFREVGFRSNGADFIPRRYCTAMGHLTDGKIRKVTYWIGEDLGFVGGDYMGIFAFFDRRTNIINNWGVTFCVEGLDRNYAYGQGCQAAGP